MAKIRRSKAMLTQDVKAVRGLTICLGKLNITNCRHEQYTMGYGRLGQPTMYYGLSYLSIREHLVRIYKYYE